MLKIKANKQTCESIFKKRAMHLLSIMTSEQAGWPHCPSGPNTPLEPAQGIRPVVNKHKPTKEKFAFKQTSKLVELKSWL